MIYQPFLFKIVNCNSIDDIINLEKEPLFNIFSEYKLIYKILVLESAVKQVARNYGNLLVHIYRFGAVKAIYDALNCAKLTGGQISAKRQLEASYKIMKRAYEYLGWIIKSKYQSFF